MKVKLIVEGGKMQPGPTVAQQLGPMGINLGKVIADVNKATEGFKGMNVPVEIDVDGKEKTYTIQVFSPSVAELIKKELGLEKGSGMPQAIKVGNISFERVVGIAKTKMPDLLARDLRAAVRLVVGTCLSIGVLIDSKEPKEIEIEITKGIYDKEIQNEVTEATTEKKNKLEAYFAEVNARQEKVAKAAEEAKAAAEAAAAAATVTGTGAPGAGSVPGAVGAATTTSGTGAAGAVAKPEAKGKEAETKVRDKKR